MILTAEPPRIYFFWRRDSAKQKRVLVGQSVLLAPLDIRKYPGSVTAQMLLLIQSPSPDWIRKRVNSALSAAQR